MCSHCYCLRLPGEVSFFFLFFPRLPPTMTLYIRTAASRDKHFSHHGFSEELTKNFFFRYFSYDERILVNKFILKKNCTCLCSENHFYGNYWVIVRNVRSVTTCITYHSTRLEKNLLFHDVWMHEILTTVLYNNIIVT